MRKYKVIDKTQTFLIFFDFKKMWKKWKIIVLIEKYLVLTQVSAILLLHFDMKTNWEKIRCFLNDQYKTKKLLIIM